MTYFMKVIENSPESIYAFFILEGQIKGHFRVRLTAITLVSEMTAQVPF